MNVHLLTPLTWSAALVPLLDARGLKLTLHAPDDYATALAAMNDPIDAGSAGMDCTGDSASMLVAYVDREHVVEIAMWATKRSPFIAPASAPFPLLLVVGEGSLRYQWQLRELGAIDVVGSVRQAKRVAKTVLRHAARFPVQEPRWPISAELRERSNVGASVPAKGDKTG